MIKIKQPETKEEFEEYYYLRWKILRKPWNQPKVDDEDGLEKESIHIIAVDEEKHKVVGVGRLHKNSKEEGHIRYMAVEEEYRDKGIGKAILNELHIQAKNLGLKRIVLNARKNVVSFYEKFGYRIVGKAHILFGVIPHYRMEYKIK